MTEQSPIKLRLPTQDLASFSHFALNTEAAHHWALGLPVANTRKVVHELRAALGELNRVEMAPQNRFNILEALRPRLLVALSTLTKRFLNQPLVLPEEPRQLAEVVSDLYSQACTAYTIVAITTIQRSDTIRDVNPARLACEALQRAVNLAGRAILQSYQLYQPVAAQSWLRLHQLFAMAERQQLAHLPVVDQISGSTTITSAYLQPLLLGCCKPNQLRQSDIAGIYRGLQEWSELIRLQDPATGKGLFLIDLNNDQPPMYSALSPRGAGAQCRFINTEPLVAHLEQLRQIDKQEGRKGLRFDEDNAIPSNILDHLIDSLGSMSQRNFTRVKSGSKLWLGIGLSSAHFRLAEDRTLEQVLHGAHYLTPAADRIATNPFLVAQDKKDVWDKSGEDDVLDREEAHKDDQDQPDVAVPVDESTLAELMNTKHDTPPEQQFPMYPVTTINASPGGYCIELDCTLPSNVKTGDIVCVREDGQQAWVIAVIRWVSQIENAKPLMGLELLSPRATSYGATIKLKSGEDSEPMRVLLLPEIKLVGQPHTLITPRSGFRERQTVQLIKEGEEFLVKLIRQIAVGNTFCQFDFKYIRQLEDLASGRKSTPKVPSSTFDSVWKEL
ncbi:MAG: GTPase [Halioglobus sp.]